MKRNDPSKKRIDIRLMTPTQFRLRKKHTGNYEVKQTEMAAVLRVIGYVYLGFIDEAKQLADIIMDKVRRQQSIFHHDSQELTNGYKVNRAAHHFIVATQLFDEPHTPNEAITSVSLSILREFSETFLLQLAVFNNNMAIEKQYGSEALAIAHRTIVADESEFKANTVRNEPLAMETQRELILIADKIKNIRGEIRSLNDEIDIKFNYYAQLLIELSIYSHLRFPECVYSAIKIVIQHELLLLKLQHKEFSDNQKIGLLFQELDAQRATLKKLVTQAKPKQQDKVRATEKISTQTTPRKSNRSKRRQKQVNVDPQHLMLEAYTLLKTGDFPQALTLYDKALQAAKENADILAEVQSLLTKAECYELWSKANAINADKNKDYAIATFKAVMTYVMHYQHSTLYEDLVPYQAFANLALDRLVDRRILLDTQIADDIAAAKYEDESAPLLTKASESLGQEKEKLPLPVIKAGRSPAYYKLDGVLEIDSPILALMDDIPDSYIVGGAVRDFVLNTSPREYDIISSSTPQEIYELLVKRGYQCEIVGIAYPIVLVTLTASLKVEVATFRGVPPSVSTDKVKYDEKTHMIIYNQNYASHPYEDTFNRDTPINACYYNPRTKEIFTYLKETVDNFESKKLQMIGCPIRRFTEDPVRMLRILELSHRTGFTLDESVQAAIFECRNKLKFISPGRLFHQCHKIFSSGHAKPLFYSLLSFQLMDNIFPSLLPHLGRRATSYHPVIQHLLSETDIYFYHHQAISYPLIFATLLWPVLLQELKEGNSLESAANTLLAEQRKVVSISPYMFANIKAIWLSFLQKNHYFPELTSGAVLSRNDMGMICLAEKFSQYVSCYTSYVLTLPNKEELTREPQAGKSGFFQPGKSVTVPSAHVLTTKERPAGPGRN